MTFNGSFEESFNLKGKLVRFKRLNEIPDYFSQLKKDEEVMERVPNWITWLPKLPVCLVVGIMMFEDAEVSWEGEAKREVEGRVQLPIATIVQGTTGAPIPQDTGDPKITAVSKQTTATVFRAKDGNSKIFALELMRVNKGFFRRRELKLKELGQSVTQGRAFDSEEEDKQEGDDEMLLENLELTPKDLEDLED